MPQIQAAMNSPSPNVENACAALSSMQQY